MLASSIPAKFNIPFANSAGAGYIRPIPQASQIGIQAGAASLTDGFPPVTMNPGGWPFGQDFNGIFNQITAWNQWQGAGGQAQFDGAYSTAIGGYPRGATLSSSTPGTFWLSLVDNNTVNPDSGPSANWAAFSFIPGVQSGAYVYSAAGGSANAYTGACTPAAIAYTTGMQILVNFGTPNTTTNPTLNWCGLGAKIIVKRNGSALAFGDLAGWLPLLYDGINLRVNTYVASDFPSKLVVAANYYVDPTIGSDTLYDGSQATISGSKGPWATLNHAWSWLQQNINANGQNITINCASPNSPTAYAQFSPSGSITGVFSSQQVSILGDVATQKCQISINVANQGAVNVTGPSLFTIQGFNLANSGSLAAGINVSGGGQVVFGSMSFGACGAYTLTASGPGSTLTQSAGSTIVIGGNCIAALRASQTGQVHVDSATINTTTMTVSSAFVSADDLGVITAGGVTFTNNVTGPRYTISGNSVLDTAGAQATPTTNYIPGSSAGATASGGQVK